MPQRRRSGEEAARRVDGRLLCACGQWHCSADHTLEHDHEWAADQAGRRSGRGVLARLPYAPGLDADHRSPILQPDPGQPSLSALRLTVRGGRWAADAAHRQAAVGRQSERLQLVSEGAPQAPWRRRGRRLDAVRRHPRLDCHGRADVPRRISRVAQPLLHRCLRGRFAANGVVDKFVGDELVAVFPPVYGDDHPKRAVEAAQALLRATGHADPGGPWAPIGAGVHTGRVWFGAVGEGSHVEITVVGDAVNTTARLAAEARRGRDPRLDRCGSRCRPGSGAEPPEPGPERQRGHDRSGQPQTRAIGHDEGRQPQAEVTSSAAGTDRSGARTAMVGAPARAASSWARYG